MATINGDETNNVLDGTTEDDIINGLGGDDIVNSSLGADVIDGGDGIDTVSYAGSNAGVFFRGNQIGSGGHAEGDALSNIERIIGSDFNDTVENSSGYTNGFTFEGGLGDDIFTSENIQILQSAITFLGGEGSDTARLSTRASQSAEGILAQSVFDGGEGVDFFEITRNGSIDLTETTIIGFEQLIFRGTTDNYTLTFTAAQFEQFGFVETNRTGELNINIEMGDLLTFDLSGVGTGGNNASAQDFFIVGDTDSETIIGSNRGDVITGNAGDDTLNGGEGNDTLVAGVQVVLGQNLITNGDFSSGGTSWTANNPTGGQGPRFSNSFAQFNSANEEVFGDSIQQDVVTTIGSGYRIAMEVFVVGQTRDHDLTVDLLDDLGNVVATQTVTVSSSTRADFVLDFTAVSTTSTLRITNPSSSTSISSDVALDNVSVAEILIDDTGPDGDNSLFGEGGDDLLISGNGADLMDGGDGTDTASYEDAKAGVTANLGDATLNAGEAAGDTYVSIENLTGSAFDDILTGDAADNVITGGKGADTIDGGDGFDFASYADSDVAVTIGQGGGAGDTFANIEGIIGSDFNDTLQTDRSASVSTIFGGGGDDRINTRGKVGEFFGEDGNDRFGIDSGRSIGAATYDGGDGQDRMDFGGTPLVQNFLSATLTSIETFNFSGRSALMRADQFADIETISRIGVLNIEMGDTDLLDLSTINFTNPSASALVDIIGDAEAETITGSSIRDVITGAGGDDTLIGGAGDDILNGGAGADFLDGGQNFDTVTYADDTAGVIVNLDSIDRLGVASNRALDGSGSTDTLRFIEFATGSDFDDSLFGSANRNTLNGGDGADDLFGRGGNDTLIGGLGDDLLDGASGVDTADYSGAGAAIDIDLLSGTASDGDGGTDTLVSIESVIGSAFDDIIVGADGNEVFSGGDGIDDISGGLGNDTLNGEAGDDDLDGGDGNDRLNGGDGIDTMLGGVGNDVLDGGLGNDRMFGGNGDDRMFGRDGDDAMRGGIGVDVLNGQDGNDDLKGQGDRDFLRGQEGDDLLDGGEGDDRLDGGSGVDTAVYTGNQSDYLIIVRDNGVVSVEDLNLADGDDGRDVLTTVEFLQFADGTLDLALF